jgi:hypothetical protein
MPNFTPPTHNARSFNCPQPGCGVLAHHIWGAAMVTMGGTSRAEDFMFSICSACGKLSVWKGGTLIYPAVVTAPPPNPDMPAAILADYEEARQIANMSARGSVALLRLAIQKLCVHLGQAGKNLNDDIGALVKAGLPPRVPEALDALRVIGNNAVHPGQIDLTDDAAMANALFEMVNFVVEKMVTEPKQIDELYKKLPPGALEAIKKRDGA